MCGIVGYVGSKEAISFLIPALRRLEYRGYDSAGVATLNGHGIELRKAAGKIVNLETSLAGCPPQGHLGIAHTRWATHGVPSQQNAHPHVDCRSHVAIVHNGIVENHRELRTSLASRGHRFRSQTDTEIVAHLIEEHLDLGLLEALRQATERLEGSYAMACIAHDAPETIVALRRGSSPLILGHGPDETYLASDIPALLGVTEEITVLEEDQFALLTPHGITIRDRAGKPTVKSVVQVGWDAQAAAKAGYPHFMLKEIFEQPDVVRATLAERLDVREGEVHLPELGLTDRELVRLNRLCFVGCGTSWHASLVGRLLVERWARLPVEAEIASEFRFRDPVMDGQVLTVPISQSGETADTLIALREARSRGSRAVAVCNVVGSSLSREADGVVHTRAGIEIGVASTKAFTAQLAAVTLLALKLGRARQIVDRDAAREIGLALEAIPQAMERVLEESDRIRHVAELSLDHDGALFLGRGVHYPMALEGALKLKEVSYVHAEGCAAGEMKHGPIALVDPELLVLAITPRGTSYAKMASTIEEVRAREGTVVAVVTHGDSEVGVDLRLSVPAVPEALQPLVVALCLQLFAYHSAELRGRDVDQPRNLAKSVTVE